MITKEKREKIKQLVLRKGMNGENIANLEDLDIKDVKEEIKKFYEKEPTIKGLEIHQLNDPDTHFPVH